MLQEAASWLPMWSSSCGVLEPAAGKSPSALCRTAGSTEMAESAISWSWLCHATGLPQHRLQGTAEIMCYSERRVLHPMHGLSSKLRPPSCQRWQTRCKSELQLWALTKRASVALRDAEPRCRTLDVTAEDLTILRRTAGIVHQGALSP